MRRSSAGAGGGLVLAVALLLAFAASASANPWPNWTAAEGNSFAFTVTPLPGDYSASGFVDFVLTVDSGGTVPGWGVKAFVVYLDGLSSQLPQGSDTYDNGNTKLWEDTNGGWEKNKYPGPANTTAAFGWQANGGPPDYIRSGDVETFHAQNLPSFTSVHYLVHAVSPDGAVTFWAGPGTPPDILTPEPASLALLTLGLGGALPLMRRRRV